MKSLPFQLPKVAEKGITLGQSVPVYLGHYRWEVTEIVIVDVLGVIGKATYDKQNL